VGKKEHQRPKQLLDFHRTQFQNRCTVMLQVTKFFWFLNAHNFVLAKSEMEGGCKKERKEKGRNERRKK
jgi:hypothetical protein